MSQAGRTPLPDDRFRIPGDHGCRACRTGDLIFSLISIVHERYPTIKIKLDTIIAKEVPFHLLNLSTGYALLMNKVRIPVSRLGNKLHSGVGIEMNEEKSR
jgi:hypothetical protein